MASRLHVPPTVADYVAATIKKGFHVLVEGSFVSTTYERGNGKGKKAKTNKQTFWCKTLPVFPASLNLSSYAVLSMPHLFAEPMTS